MGVIPRKQANAARAFSFEDVEHRARALLAAARAQAARIVHDAEDDAAGIVARQRQTAYEQGLAEGRQAGLAQARAEARAAAQQAASAELAQLTRALQAGLAEVERNKRSLLAQAETGLIELALAIARRVCKFAAGASSAAAQANCRTLLELVRHADDVEVRFSPADHALLAETTPALARDVAALEHVRVVADDAVGPGGCIVRTQDAVLDATLATQLDRVAAEICPAAGAVGSDCPTAGAVTAEICGTHAAEELGHEHDAPRA
ncbi:MAG: FliH/SctL family protein [Planctomycetota bacterium]